MTNELEFTDTVYGLAAAVENGKEICFAAKQSGLYRSDDFGKTWQALFSSLEVEGPIAASGVLLSPNFSEDGCLFAAVPGGVLRSDNRGLDWTVAVFPAPTPLISSLAISPNFPADGIVFAGTYDDGIFRSSTGGARWTAWNFGLVDPHVYCVAVSPDFLEDKTVIVGVETGVFRSINGGLGWRPCDFPMETAPVQCIAISPNFGNDGMAFAGTETGSVFVSKDSGQTWSVLPNLALGGPVNAIILSPNFSESKALIVASETTLWVSRDLGTHWQVLREGLNFEESLMCVAQTSAGYLVGLANGEINPLERKD